MVLVPLKKKHSGTGITYFCVHRFGGALPMHARFRTVVDSLLNFGHGCFRQSVSEACAASKGTTPAAELHATQNVSSIS
jgi:hypothetical protein